MLGDDLRAIVDGATNEGVGIEAFGFAVFADPSATSRWVLQLDEHHVELNVTLDCDAYSPVAQIARHLPAGVRRSGCGVAAVGRGDGPRARSSRQPDAGAGRAGRDGIVPEPIGIPGSLLNATDQDVARTLRSSPAVSMRRDRRCAGAARNPHAPENATPATPTTIQPSAAARVSAHHAEREISSSRRTIDQIQAPLPSGMASAKKMPKV